MNVRVGPRRFALVFLVFVAGLTAPAAASAGWSQIEPFPGFSGPRPVGLEQIKQEDGSRFLYWTRDVGGSDIVQAMRYSADGTPGPILALSNPGDFGRKLRAVVAPDGVATVAWIAPGVPNEIVKSVRVPAQGGPGPVTNLSAPGGPGQDVETLSLDVAENGAVGVSWRRLSGLFWRNQIVTIAPDGTQSAVTDLGSFPDNVLSSAIAALPEGRFKISWAFQDAQTQFYNVASLDLEANGAPTPGAEPTYIFPREKQRLDAEGKPVLDGQGEPVMDPDGSTAMPRNVNLGTLPDGSGTLSWERFTIETSLDPQTGQTVVDGAQIGAEVSQFTAGTQPTQFARVSPLNSNISDSRLNMVAQRRNSMTWNAERNGTTTAQFHRFAGGGIWNLTTEPIVGEPAVDLAADGSAVIGWTENGMQPGTFVAEALRIRRGGAARLAEFPGLDALKSSSGPLPDVGEQGQSRVIFYGLDQSDVGGFWTSRFTDPAIAIAPSRINFGTGLLNTRNGVRRAFISNSGTTPNNVTGVTLSGADANDYSLVNPSACLGELPPGGSCEIAVTFVPGQVGLKTARIDVQSDAGPVSSDLSGSSVARTRLRMGVVPKRKAVRPGRSTVLRIKVKNTGGIRANRLRVCMRTPKANFRPARKCVRRQSLAAGATWNAKFRVRAKNRARAGRKHGINFRLRAGNAKPRRAQAIVRIR